MKYTDCLHACRNRKIDRDWCKSGACQGIGDTIVVECTVGTLKLNINGAWNSRVVLVGVCVGAWYDRYWFEIPLSITTRETKGLYFYCLTTINPYHWVSKNARIFAPDIFKPT